MKHVLRTFALLFAAAMTFTSCSDKDNDLYTIIVSANNSDWGSVYGGGKYEAGTEIQIAASPVAGYKFARWNDNNTDNPRTIKVTEDAAYMAIFEDINGGGDNPTPGPGGYDTIPHDSTSHAWITFGDTTWAGLTVVKQTGNGYHQLSLMADENAEGPTLSFTFPGTTGTFTSANSNILSVYYMEHGFQDFVEVNGQQYPRWLAVGSYTVNIIEYDLNAGYVTCTIEAELLNMENEGQGLPQEFKHLTVDIEKMYFLSYN
ncbi:MAG: hypothetical protein IJ634_07105 [Bacteroidales bacterium]|nr:hypothetical protein [Bacteroidales bacterium]